jgi:hypothetical protein
MVDCPKCDGRATNASIEKYGSCAKCKPKAFNKKSIPKSLKNAVWIKTFGTAEAGRCRCGDRILKVSHHCGHKIAESKGGDTAIDNLESICASCNLRMKTIEMNDWYIKHGGIIDMHMEMPIDKHIKIILYEEMDCD